MVLAQIYDFKPGILYLYEKAKQYQQIVQYYMVCHLEMHCAVNPDSNG